MTIDKVFGGYKSFTSCLQFFTTKKLQDN